VRRDIKGYSLAFIIALTANVFFFSSFQGLFPVLPRFIAEVVVKRPVDSVGGEVGLASALMALVAVFTRVPAGQLADRWGRRRFMFVGAACFALAPLIYTASQGMGLFLWGRAVHGVGLATFTPAFQALAADLAPADRRGEVMGLAGASSSMAFVCAPLLGDWLASTLGYTPVFGASAVVGAISVCLVLLIGAPPVPASEKTSAAEVGLTTRASLRLTLTQKGVRAGVLTMAALGVPFGTLIAFLPLLAAEKGVAGVGGVFSVYAVTVFVSQPLAGWLSDRAGRRGVILPGLVLTSLATVVLYLGASSWAFLLAGGLFGLGGGMVRGGIDAMVQDSVPSTLRGTAAAVQYTSFDFWIGVSSYPAGLLANAVGYATTFVVTGAICLAGAGALMLYLASNQGQG
jgi:MFS family permease